MMEPAQLIRPTNRLGRHDLGALRVGSTVPVLLASLVEAEAPRIGGLDDSHVQLLAALRPEALPPILVRRTSLRVIDGAHRVAAARRRGERSICATMCDGTDEDCFIASVTLNVSHGKPLTFAERRRAAERLLIAHSTWSDRSIADICAVAPSTVAGLRNLLGETDERSSARLGRDGIVRPFDAARARAEAQALMTESPGTSLRQVARTVGASVATVRDVRKRMTETAASDAPDRWERTATLSPHTNQEHATDVEVLEMDSALRGDNARRFLDWFNGHLVRNEQWEPLAGELPLSRLYPIIDEAYRCARVWNDLATYLESRTRSTRRTGP
jgi:ParB-like chromosome segregation protein Spo0J